MSARCIFVDAWGSLGIVDRESTYSYHRMVVGAEGEEGGHLPQLLEEEAAGSCWHIGERPKYVRHEYM